jgi:hypothetical protein
MSDMGFVAVEDIANVFTEGKRELEEELIRMSGTSYPKYPMAILERMQHELYKRAKAHLQEVLRRNPAALKDPAREKADAAAAQEEARNRQSYQDRVARGRAQAFADQNAKGK